jgi:hypothetical protein
MVSSPDRGLLPTFDERAAAARQDAPVSLRDIGLPDTQFHGNYASDNADDAQTPRANHPPPSAPNSGECQRQGTVARRVVRCAQIECNTRAIASRCFSRSSPVSAGLSVLFFAHTRVFKIRIFACDRCIVEAARVSSDNHRGRGLRQHSSSAPQKCRGYRWLGGQTWLVATRLDSRRSEIPSHLMYFHLLALSLHMPVPLLSAIFPFSEVSCYLNPARTLSPADIDSAPLNLCVRASMRWHALLGALSTSPL